MATGFTEDHQGNIWIGTNNDGVYRYNNGTWERFLSTDAGVKLPNDQVNCVVAGPDGRLWFGTSHGAAIFDGSSWYEIPAEAGLVNEVVNGIYIDSSGAVWFGINGGITRWEPYKP